MAHPKHAALLLEGVAAWNAWRRAHPRVRPELGGLALEGACLRGFDLRRARLGHAMLRGADLREADLRGAVLANADLREARLDRADLRGADLWRVIADGARARRASFEGALLYQARFRAADLTDASLAGADAHEAVLDEAVLRRADLRDTNLDAAGLSLCDLSSCRFGRTVLVNARIANSRLVGADLAGVNLSGVVFWRSDLSRADLRGALCENTEFAEARLVRTRASGAAFQTVEFRDADLTGADLHESVLENCSLVRATVEGADFHRCIVYGLSAWDLKGTPRRQDDLVITPAGEPDVTVDDLEVAQFVYLVCSNPKIRRFLDAFTEKNVLILGRFALPERKAVLDGLRRRLREFDLVPIVFDFEHPRHKDFTETVQVLAGMSMFVIADVTAPKSTPLELEATAKQFKIPFVPILDTSVDERPFAMLVDLQRSLHWVLPTFGYRGADDLFAHLKPAIVDRALHKHRQLRELKATQTVTMVSSGDFAPAKRAPARRAPGRPQQRARR